MENRVGPISSSMRGGGGIGCLQNIIQKSSHLWWLVGKMLRLEILQIR